MFGYKCQECGEGTVRETACENLEVKFDRIPFVVPQAVIGVCDHCGAEHFDSREYRRWRSLFEEEQARIGGVLCPGEIRDLRGSLGMTMKDFAALIGVTRQSIHHWEKEERSADQCRMADLMLRLVRESARRGAVNVVEFLYRTARGAGIDVSIAGRGSPSEGSDPGATRRPADAIPEPECYDHLFESAPKRTTSPCLRLVA